MTTGDPDIDAQIASEMASILSLEATLDQTRAQLAAAERTIEKLRATRQVLLDDLVKAAGREIALQETIEKLGEDAAAIAGRLDRAVDWLRLVARSPKSYNPMALGQFLRDLDKGIASPSQPEPVKAHAFVPCKGDHGPCRFGEFGLCTFNDCGQPDGSPWHATIVPENAGTTCAACKGKGGFDPFGEPMEGQMNPAYQCGACQGRGMK